MKKRKLNKEVKQWINYLKKDNNAAEWDWSFLLKMEQEKLRRMADWFEKKGCHATVEKEVNEMRLAVRLLDIILQESDHEDTYVNIRNIRRFFSKLMTEYLLKDIHKGITYNTDISPVPLKENALRSIRVQKAWYLYNKLRYYFLRNWWD